MKINPIVLGVDIGGTHVTVALVDLQSGKVLPDTWTREAVNTHGTKEEIINAWSRTMERSIGGVREWSGKIGIAMPGPCDYEKGVSLIKDQDKLDALYGLNIKNLLAENLPVQSENIRMMNDAGCFLKGEAYAGAAKNYQHAIGLTLGTGVGTARYHTGTAADADLWHTSFRDGMPEDYFTSRWFRKRFMELTGKKVQGAKEIAELFDTDSNARQVFEEYGEALGEFLVYFVDLDKPEVVVLGGNIANALPLFLPFVEKVLGENSIEVPVKKATLGENASLLGAASCWEKEVIKE